MDLSPNDIRNYEFSTQMRGYDKDDVDSFLDQVATALENSKQENLRLTMEMESLRSQLAGLKQFEDTIKNAAIDARRNADTLVASAKKEAEQIRSNANAEVQKTVGQQVEKAAALEDQINELELAKRSFIVKLRSLINTHLEMVDEIAKADIKRNLTTEVLDKIEITESTDVSRNKRETIATTPSKDTIKTEEANAPEKIVAAKAASTDELMAEAGIDPELAAALKKYQKLAQQSHKTETAVSSETPIKARTPKPGELIETTRRAEDIPDGFITNGINNPKTDFEAIEDASDTDKVRTEAAKQGIAPDVQDAPTEHNDIDIDTPILEDKKVKPKAGASPDNIAQALDQVVAKFEEEMDKAAKS